MTGTSRKTNLDCFEAKLNTRAIIRPGLKSPVFFFYQNVYIFYLVLKQSRCDFWESSQFGIFQTFFFTSLLKEDNLLLKVIICFTTFLVGALLAETEGWVDVLQQLHCLRVVDSTPGLHKGLEGWVDVNFIEFVCSVQWLNCKIPSLQFFSS